jgi:hypothetical protein
MIALWGGGIACQEVTETNPENLKSCQEMTACHEAMKVDTERTKPDPGMMQSVGEHQVVPKEEAAVMPVGGLRKRCRDQNLAAGRCQKLNGMNQASCESWKRLTFAA